ncbi:MAG TPA: hypothetical protein VMX17_04630 [Candidatus Glassbacteria bacterium]|nr:hypothetical protein [Candidatus Glassbacteria bacterium]
MTTEINDQKTETTTTENHSYPRKRISSIKGRLNIVCRGYVKDNKAGGEIIAVVPDIPISAWLDDLLIIFTIPNEDQPYAPTYIRLQDKENYGAASDSGEEIKQFNSDIRVTGYLKQKRGEIIVCAPKTHVKVDLNEIVIIATIPGEDKDRAPCYIKPKAYKFEGRKRRQEVMSPPNGNEEDDTMDDQGEDIDVDDINISDHSGINN